MKEQSIGFTLIIIALAILSHFTNFGTYIGIVILLVGLKLNRYYEKI